MSAAFEQLFGAAAVPATIFFVALGIFQLMWIGVIIKSNNRGLLAVGILEILFSILIYFISTAMPPPFGVPPQPLTAYAVFIKALEAGFVLASL